MTSPRKLLVLGLDAASPVLLRRWAADGTLPHLGELMERGLTGSGRSVDGLFVGATWPSFATGLHPGHHGLYWLDRLIPGTYRTQRARPRDLGRCPALWEVLSAAGSRVAVMDVPLTRLSPGLNGMQVVEWGVHDAAFGFRTRPRSLGPRIRRLVGPHPAPARCDAPARTLEQYRDFAARLSRGAEARATLTRRLLSAPDWDFAIQVFSETHCAGHQLWHFHDEAHPDFDSRGRERFGDPVRSVYEAVDRAIGQILAGLGPDRRVVVVALHGMGSTGGASLLLPEILRRLGVMDAAMDPASPAPPGGRADPLDLLRQAYRALPEAVRLPVYRGRQRINQWLGRGTAMALMPEQSRAFPVDLGTGAPYSGIRLNLKDREPSGVLSPDEVSRFSAELEADLRALVDPDSGRPVVSRILRTAELYPGEYAGALPDLLVEWDMTSARGTAVAGSGAGREWRVTSPRTGTVAAVNTYCRTGEHRIEGMFVAAGPGVPRGELEGTVSVLDYAPTFARFLGTAMPAADGREIAELIG